MLIKPRRVRGAAAAKEWDHFSDDMRVRKTLLRVQACEHSECAAAPCILLKNTRCVFLKTSYCSICSMT